MKRGLALLALSLALLGAESAERKGIRQDLQGILKGAEHSLDISLACLDDAAFEACLSEAAGRGVKIRLVLHPRYRSNRQAALRLSKLGVSLRFSPDIETRAIIADASRVAVGEFDAYPKRLDEEKVSLTLADDAEAGSALGEQFDAAWATAQKRIPESLSLKDELDDLPDPTEREPHLQTKRRIDKS